MTAEVQKYSLEQIEALELAPGAEHEQLEGWVPALAIGRRPAQSASKRPSTIAAMLRSRSNPARSIEAYIFNRQTGATLAESCVQYFTPNSPDKRKVSYAEIARLEFTGKDRAAGKHWEDWVKAWNEKKAAGEKNIGLHPDALE